MIVRAHQIQRLSLALERPLRTAGGEFRTREGVQVTLEADGVAGVGEAMPLEAFGTESLDDSRAAIEAATGWLAGATVPEELAAVDAFLSGCGALSSAPAARHAVECALLDLLARRRQVPLRALLSSASRNSVAVNALLNGDEPEALAADGLRAVQDGFSVLKVKVAVGEVEHDERRLAELRRAVGPRPRLRIDANGGWATAAEAQRALAMLAAFGVELCEQPVPAADLDGLRRLRLLAAVPVAADESVSSEAAANALIEARAVDVLVLRPMVLGGLVATLRVALKAQGRGLRSYVASSLDGVMARAAAAHVAACMPDASFASGLATGRLFVGELQNAFSPRRGRIYLPQVAGLGLELERRAA